MSSRKLVAILIVLNALAWGLTAPRLWATGTLATPNTLANLPESSATASMTSSRSSPRRRAIKTDMLSKRPRVGRNQVAIIVRHDRGIGQALPQW